MECILHIGTEKTGTTSLQHFLSANRAKLLKEGLCYTQTLGKTANNGICLLSYPAQRRDNLTDRLRVTSDDDFSNKQNKLLKRLKKEIEHNVKLRKVEKFIISSELIQSRLTTDKDVQRLKSILVDELGFDKIKVVVYLREPALTAQSLYSTAIKHGHTWEYPPVPSDEYFGNICNHKSTLIRFGNIFGYESLVIRLFQKKDLHGNSVITDFFHVLQLPLLSRYKHPRNSNVSLSFTAISLLRTINKYWPRIIGGYPNVKRRDLIKLLENNSTSAYNMPVHLKEEYHNYFIDSNEWVRENYFPQRESLFYTRPMGENHDSHEKLDMEELAKLLMGLIEMHDNSGFVTPLKNLARLMKEKYTL